MPHRPNHTASPNWTGVACGMAIALLAAYQQFKLPPALPLMVERYGYGQTVAGGFMSVFAVAGLALSLPLGKLIQRDGSAVYLAMAFVLMLAATALALVAPQSAWVVLLARGLEGIGFAILAIVGPVLVSRSAGPAHLAIASGLTATWIPAGQLLAIVVAQPAMAARLWQPLWLFGAVATVALAACTYLLARSGRLDLDGKPGAKPVTAATQLADSDKRTALQLSAAVFCLWSVQFIAYMTWLPSYLVDAHGMNYSMAVLGYAVPIVTLMVFNLATGWILRSGVPLGRLLVGGLVGQALVWAALPVTGGGIGGVVSLIGYGIGAGITPTCLWALPNAIAGRSAGAQSFGVLMVGRNLGTLAGPLLLAALVEGAGTWLVAAPTFTATTLVAVFLAVRLSRKLA